MRDGMLLLGWAVLATSALGQEPVGRPPAAGAAQVAPMVVESLRNFNPEALSLAWNNRCWQLVCDQAVLKDFGPHEQEARQALRLIHELGVNQYGTIGSPWPVMEYWLVNGKAPRSSVQGNLASLPLQPDALRVEQVQGQWCLRDGQRVLFSFASHVDEAQQALAVVRKYGFRQIAVLGRAAPLMYVFFGQGDSDQSALPSAHSGHESSRQMSSPRFSRLARNPDGTPHVEKAPRPSGLEGAATAMVPPLSQANAGVRQTTFWRKESHSAPAECPGRMAFDWRQVQMRQDQGEWKLMAGTTVLENFGGNVQDARMALSALRHYRFTERWRTDRPGGFDYYLANGQSPRGLMFGLTGDSFAPDKVELQQEAGEYALVDGPRVLLRFGAKAEEAHKALEAIQRGKFDRVCKLGEPGKEPMTLFLHSR
jgi:hypothetical protein